MSPNGWPSGPKYVYSSVSRYYWFLQLGTSGIAPGPGTWTENQVRNPHTTDEAGDFRSLYHGTRAVEELTLASFLPGNFTDTSAVAASLWCNAYWQLEILYHDAHSLRRQLSGIKTPQKNFSASEPYPNPAKRYITIEYTFTIGAHYQIYDITRKQVISGKITDANKSSISISALKSGYTCWRFQIITTA